MDPNLIHVDWERTFEALTMIIIFAFVVERALAVVFETRTFIEYFDRNGLKELIAIAVAIAVCVFWQFDALGMFLLTETTTAPGYAVTGLVVAGGSKVSIKLFHDLLDVKSSAYNLRHEIKVEKAVADAKSSATDAAAATSPAAAQIAVQKAEAAARRAKSVAIGSGSPNLVTSAEQAELAAKSARAAVQQLKGKIVP
jgi:hypothetical protein